VALDPDLSFAVAFRGEGGELQLCAYQAQAKGEGDFLLLNLGVINASGEYHVPPPPAPMATGYQPGTFLVGVTRARTGIARISPFTQGTARVEELSTTHVRGTFLITSVLAKLTDGRFDVPMARLADLPRLCQ
jgi:hypothetical protein